MFQTTMRNDWALLREAKHDFESTNLTVVEDLMYHRSDSLKMGTVDFIYVFLYSEGKKKSAYIVVFL